MRRHHIACAFLLEDGTRVSGINLVSNLGPASVCAEQVALGEKLKTFPDQRVVLVLTLRAAFAAVRDAEIVSPCGRCREILHEYAPDARVVLSLCDGTAGCHLVPITSLIPYPFRRRDPNMVVVDADR